MSWLILIAICAFVFIAGIICHSFWLFLLAGVLLFGGALIFDALEEGTENEFLNAIFRAFGR